jgi:tRNA (mo5U34)-methyltransferase
VFSFRKSIGGADFSLVLQDGLHSRLKDSSLLAPFRRGRKSTAATLTVPSAPPGVNGANAHLLKEIAAINWYHTLDFGNGVVTPGAFDLKPLLPRYHLPESVKGLRVLDVACFDGYFAFEFEKRGAAEVVAVDVASMADVDLAPSVRRRLSTEELNRPTGFGFELAKRVYGSKVRRELISVYDLSPERLGSFDIVFCGSLLLHLLNPFKALERMRSVVRGYAHLADYYDPGLPSGMTYYRGGTDNYVWWSFSLGVLERMIRDAGFERVELRDTFTLAERGCSGHVQHAVFNAFPNS